MSQKVAEAAVVVTCGGRNAARRERREQGARGIARDEGSLRSQQAQHLYRLRSPRCGLEEPTSKLKQGGEQVGSCGNAIATGEEYTLLPVLCRVGLAVTTRALAGQLHP